MQLSSLAIALAFVALLLFMVNDARSRRAVPASPTPVTPFDRFSLVQTAGKLIDPSQGHQWTVSQDAEVQLPKHRTAASTVKLYARATCTIKLPIADETGTRNGTRSINLNENDVVHLRYSWTDKNWFRSDTTETALA